MAIVTEYRCEECGLELADDDRVFIWDEESNTTKDFLILMMTHMCLNDAKITGNVSETYCSECGKFVKVYSIREVKDEIPNPCEVVRQGIKNYIAYCGKKLDELKDIKNRPSYTIEREDGHYVMEIPEFEFTYAGIFSGELTKVKFIEEALDEFYDEINEVIESHEKTYSRYLNSIYLVVDETGRQIDDYDPLEKVSCPVCRREIHKHVNGEVPCPRCGGRLNPMNFTCYD